MRHLEDPELWRRRAREVRVVAALWPEPIERAELLGIAEDYERMAEQAAKNGNGRAR